jgi:hypothetical protein
LHELDVEHDPAFLTAGAGRLCSRRTRSGRLVGMVTGDDGTVTRVVDGWVYAVWPGRG